MSRKLELRTKLSEIQKQYSEIAAELKEIQLLEQGAALRERYKDYLYKVQFYYDLNAEEQILDVTDEDRELARVSSTGFIITGPEEREAISYVMLKDKSEYARVKLLFDRIGAVNKIQSKDEKDKEKYIKILLGETDAN